MRKMIGSLLVGASKFVDIEDRQFVFIPVELEPFYISGHACRRQQRSEEMRVKSQRTEGEPVRGFFAKVVAAVKMADDIRCLAAAGNKNQSAIDLFDEPAA